MTIFHLDIRRKRKADPKSSIWLSHSDRAALRWLLKHGGDGHLLAKGHVLIVAGAVFPYVRQKLNDFCRHGFAQRYGDQRIRVTIRGVLFLRGLDSAEAAAEAELEAA